MAAEEDVVTTRRLANLEEQMKQQREDQKNTEALLVGIPTQLDQMMELISKLTGTEKDLSLSPMPMTPADSSLSAWKATSNILEKQLNIKMSSENEEIENLKLNVDELQKETTNQTDALLQMTTERNKWKHASELMMQEKDRKSSDDDDSRFAINFPSNETVIHNLLMSQIEFYFSDHHLKRDKPLMMKLTAEPVGYITFDEVCTFPKIRTLGQDKDVVRKAIMGSKYLSTQLGEGGNLLHVGRAEFTPPRAQDFPFRRTVFVYGVQPQFANENWIRNQFDCFGTIVKVKFDSGPRSSPRKVGARLLRKEPSRVTRLQIQDANHTEFKFSKTLPENLTQYICHKCNRLKEYSDGYYAARPGRQACFLFCIQCAAKKAEENMNTYNNYRSDDNAVKEILGIDDHDTGDINSFVSCLIVYESQRQASKCVYVRSRLGIDGCFATHFHNYTRNKKEICGEENGDLGPPGFSKQESSHKLVPLMSHSVTAGARFNLRNDPPSMKRATTAPTVWGSQRNQQRFGLH